MNAIVICLDTLRWDALGCYRPGWVHTPCIDAFAERCTRFDMAFCGSFPTVPMRVDAYTGDVNWPRYGWKGIDEGQPKLPVLLSEAGYRTALVLDTRNNVGVKLHECYDEHHLIEKDVDDGITPDDIQVPVPVEHYRQNAGGFRRDRANWSHYRHEEDWFAARTMRTACEWLEDNARRDRWFLWADTFEIHEDWMPPRHYVAMYDGGYTGPDYTYPNYGYTDIYEPEHIEHLRACYAGEVTFVDRWVGHLLRQLEVMGLMEKTAVILTSDHGMYIGEHGRAGKHTVDPNDPWPIYDTVGRVPLLVWTPSPNRPGTVNALCQSADLMPTVLEICGVSAPETTGRSWVPLLAGNTDAGHEAVYTSCHSGQGPGRTEYLPSLITVTTPTHTAVFGPKPREPELYDRGQDPGQLTNVAARNPGLVDEMRAGLVRFMEAQGADGEYVGSYGKGE